MKNEESSLLRKEISSRELKALKLSCIYACLNHPQELYIYQKDMEQAINTVEFLGCDFKTFLNHKLQYEDRYDRLFNFFLEHKGEDFKKITLINECYQLSGYSKNKFRKNFDNCISIVSEIASEKGYVLNKKSINHNSSNPYSSIEVKTEELSNSMNELDNLI